MLGALDSSAEQSALPQTNIEVAGLVEIVCPPIGMPEDEVTKLWGKPHSVNSPRRYFINPPEGWSYWVYQSRYQDMKLDGPPAPEDAFRLFVYFIHGRVVGTELESRKGIAAYSAHIACTTSGITSTFSLPSTNTSGQLTAPSLVGVLRDYCEAWKAGHDLQTPWMAHYVMNRCPASLTPELVAKAFRFPSQLDMADAWGMDKRHGRGSQPLWFVSFSSSSNTFARTIIAGYRQGTFVTPELANQYEAALQRLQSSASSSNWFCRFELSDKTRGYIRTESGGCILVATAPKYRLDLLLAIELPNGDGGPFYSDTPATHEYYRLVHKMPVQQLREALPVLLDGLKIEGNSPR